MYNLTCKVKTTAESEEYLMINIVLLEKEMAKRKVGKDELCRKLGLPHGSFSRIIKKGVISTREAEKIRVILELSDPGSIFFA